MQKENPPFIAKPSKYSIPLLLLALIILGNIFYSIAAAPKFHWSNPVDIFITLLFILSAIIILFQITKLDTLELNSEKLTITSIFGHVKMAIEIKDITSWSEITRQGRYAIYKSLIIFAPGIAYKINRSDYNSATYETLCNSLKTGKQRNIDYEIKVQRRYNWQRAISFWAGSLVLFYLSEYGKKTGAGIDEFFIGGLLTAALGVYFAIRKVKPQ